MRSTALTGRDLELVKAAEGIARERHRPGWNKVGAALRIRSGRMITAIHLDADIGRIAVCAEAIALGCAVADGVMPADIETVVAVTPTDASVQKFRVIDPCGMCRELISDYAPQAMVVISITGRLRKVRVAELIPGKEERRAAT